MLAKSKDTKTNLNSSSCISINIDLITEQIKDDDAYLAFLSTYNIMHQSFCIALNNFFKNRNDKIDLGDMCSEEKEIIKEIFGPNNLCKKFIYMFSMHGGIGGDESLFFLKDFINMFNKEISYLLSKGYIYNQNNKKIKLDQIESGCDYYIEYNLQDIDFEILRTIVVLLQEGPNIRVQRQPINSTQMQTSTILVNTHIFNLNKSETDIKQSLLNEKYLIWDTFRASGAGGQHVNKTSSAVRLRHKILKNVLIVSQQERSQVQNKKIALKKLEEDISANIMSIIKQVLLNKEYKATRNIKSTTYNYRRKQITHEDGFQQTFDSIKKGTYQDLSLQRIFK